MNPIGKIVKKRKIPNRKFAEMLGTTMSNAIVCQHTKLPTLESIRHIAKALHLSPNVLASRFDYYRNHMSVVNRTYEPNSISNYLGHLRREHHLSQTTLAKNLGIAQTDVSRIEHYNPDLNTIIRVDRFYKVPLIELLKRSPKYKRIKINSPSYHILNLLVICNVTVNKLAQVTGVSAGYLHNIIYNRTSNYDYIHDNLAKQLVSPFGIPISYFGYTPNHFDEVMYNYCHNQHALTEQYFGYRLEKVRCKRHITLKSIADKMGISRERVENITWTPHLTNRVMNEIVKLFPKDKDYLINGQH